MSRLCSYTGDTNVHVCFVYVNSAYSRLPFPASVTRSARHMFCSPIFLFAPVRVSFAHVSLATPVVVVTAPANQAPPPERDSPLPPQSVTPPPPWRGFEHYAFLPSSFPCRGHICPLLLRVQMQMQVQTQVHVQGS